MNICQQELKKSTHAQGVSLDPEKDPTLVWIKLDSIIAIDQANTWSKFNPLVGRTNSG